MKGIVYLLVGFLGGGAALFAIQALLYAHYGPATTLPKLNPLLMHPEPKEVQPHHRRSQTCNYIIRLTEPERCRHEIHR